MCSNNTNKLSPQEHDYGRELVQCSSNNTNKLSPQELFSSLSASLWSSNNTNKLSPQELINQMYLQKSVQIIQINLVLKNIIRHL